MDTEKAKELKSIVYDVSNNISELSYINNKVYTLLSDIYDDYFTGNSPESEEEQIKLISEYKAIQTKVIITSDIVTEAKHKIQETLDLWDRSLELLPEPTQSTYTTEFMKTYETLPFEHKVKIAKYMFNLIDGITTE